MFTEGHFYCVHYSHHTWVSVEQWRIAFDLSCHICQPHLIFRDGICTHLHFYFSFSQLSSASHNYAADVMFFRWIAMKKSLFTNFITDMNSWMIPFFSGIIKTSISTRVEHTFFFVQKKNFCEGWWKIMKCK